MQAAAQISEHREPQGPGHQAHSRHRGRDQRRVAVTEIIAGGETGRLQPGTCSVQGSSSDGSKFTFTHTYQHLALARTRIGSFPYRFRVDIDRNTGLPSRTYDVSDQSTQQSYDLLGRVLSITPSSSLRGAQPTSPTATLRGKILKSRSNNRTVGRYWPRNPYFSMDSAGSTRR